MASFRTTGIRVNILLNNGTTETGSVKTVSVSLGGTSQKINANAYLEDTDESRDCAVAIASSLSPIFDKSLYDVKEITEGSITD